MPSAVSVQDRFVLDTVHLCRLGESCPRITGAEGGKCRFCKQCPRLRHADGGVWLPVLAVAAAALPDASKWQFRDDCKHYGSEAYRLVSNAEQAAMREAGLIKGRPCAVARHDVLELVLKRRGVSDDFCRDFCPPDVPVQVCSYRDGTAFLLSALMIVYSH